MFTLLKIIFFKMYNTYNLIFPFIFGQGYLPHVFSDKTTFVMSVPTRPSSSYPFRQDPPPHVSSDETIFFMYLQTRPSSSCIFRRDDLSRVSSDETIFLVYLQTRPSFSCIFLRMYFTVFLTWLHSTKSS
jgi:hypothetical protein